MNLSSKSFLRRQVLEMDRLAELSADDPLMSFAIKKRRESLEEEIMAAPADLPKPRTVLFFAGGPVTGSRGIDADFAAEVLKPFLEMVKTQYSANKHGRVGTRGPRRGEAEARLLLTGLPRGSFGLELSQPQPEDFISAEQLSETLVLLTEIIDAAAGTDEKFAHTLDRVSPRVLPRLKDFLGVIASHKASLGMESGELKVDLPVNRIAAAVERVGAANAEDQTVKLEGIFRGATLDSWRFDFRLPDGKVVSGRIAADVEDEEVTQMLLLTNQHCLATLTETTLTTRDGVRHQRFELLRLEKSLETAA